MYHKLVNDLYNRHIAGYALAVRPSQGVTIFKAMKSPNTVHVMEKYLSFSCMKISIFLLNLI